MSGGDFAEIDLSGWPTVAIDLKKTPTSDDDIQQFFAKFTSILDIAAGGSKLRDDGTRRVEPGKIFLLFKLDGLMSASLAQQWKAGSFIRDIKPLVPASIHCTSLVVSRYAARAVLTFILSITPLSSTYSIFESSDEALVWLAANKARVAAGTSPVKHPLAELSDEEIAALGEQLTRGPE